MRLKTKAFDFTATADEAGTFTGYGSVFGVTDSYNEVVDKGAFVKSLEKMARLERSLPILWQHRTDEPIGAWSDMQEDEHGLFGKGSLWLEDAAYARIAHRGMLSKSITGLSIGYYEVEGAVTVDQKSRTRTLHEVDLIEVSIVTTPANDESRIEAVKSMLAHGDLPNIKDFERFLREAGFSKSQAIAITNGGLTRLLQSESVSETEQLIKSITDFRPSWS